MKNERVSFLLTLSDLNADGDSKPMVVVEQLLEIADSRHDDDLTILTLVVIACHYRSMNVTKKMVVVVWHMDHMRMDLDDDTDRSVDHNAGHTCAEVVRPC
jgi:hypothetical protein